MIPAASAEETLVVFEGEPVGRGIGRATPRIFTPPLRELTPETSLGFEVIEFAREYMGIELRPWQRWLLIHALELNEDGSYRFKKVIVLVARQNGKTLLVSVLSAWWLLVDSARHPEMVPPVKFKIVGTAQNLDIAREPWNQVKLWCDPEPDSEEEAAEAIPELQAETLRVSDTNGDEYIRARNLARYEIRAAKNARGKPAARVLMDELREQRTWDAWNATSQTTKSFWSGQLWGTSNAGDAKSVVLAAQRDAALAIVASWGELVVEGGMDPAEWAEEHDDGIAIFEWSGPDGCALDDDEALLQANPSCGYGGMTLRSLKADIHGMTEAAFRTEVLCQWVTADVTPYVDPDAWERGIDPESSVPEGSRVVLAVDVSSDRRTAWVAAAGVRGDGLPHVEVIARRDGVLWVQAYLRRVRDTWPEVREVALQSRGCPAGDFADTLSEDGWCVHAIDGQRLGSVAGTLLDRVVDGTLRHPPQPAVERQVRVAVTRRLGEVEVWSRRDSAAQISGLVAESEALWALERCEPPRERPKGSSHPFSVI